MSENLGGGGSLALFGGFDGFGSGAVGFFENYGVLRVPPPILRVPDSFLKFSAHGLTIFLRKSGFC